MNILVSNDDGIHASGLHALAASLADIGHVTVAAPDRERSAAGHAITMRDPLRAVQVSFDITGVRAYAVEGTPADCIKLGIDVLMDDKPDVVFSGINRGANLGTDVIYSGTVSAAIEGAIFNIPAVAMSVTSYEYLDYSAAAVLAADICRTLIEHDMPSNILLNVNIPPMPIEEIKGIRITHMGVKRYKNNYEQRYDPRGRPYYWLTGELIEEANDETSDIIAIEQGYVSITPIHYDLTKYDMIKELKRWQIGEWPLK